MIRESGRILYFIERQVYLKVIHMIVIEIPTCGSRDILVFILVFIVSALSWLACKAVVVKYVSTMVL